MFSTVVRKIFQWGVSLVLLALALLYLLSAAQVALFHGDGPKPPLYDAGVNFSISVALFGLAAVNFWVFASSPGDGSVGAVPAESTAEQ